MSLCMTTMRTMTIRAHRSLLATIQSVSSRSGTSRMAVAATAVTLRPACMSLPVRGISSGINATTSSSNNQSQFLGATAFAAAVAAASAFAMNDKDTAVTLLESSPASASDVKESATGIVFPSLVNGYTLVGTGVRVKYGLVKVYAVGTYIDTAAAKGKPTEQVLLDPTVSRTIRIVMNRNLSIQKYTDAIVESLQPRMKGQDLDKLEEFKKLNPSIDLVQGAVMEMTIRNGDTVLYKNAVGGLGSIHSRVFAQALLDTYYGADPVSPSHKASVVQGLSKL